MAVKIFAPRYCPEQRGFSLAQDRALGFNTKSVQAYGS